MNTPSYALEAGKKIENAGKVGLIGITSALAALVVAAATISDSTATFVNGAAPTGAEVNTAINLASAKVITALGLKSDNVDAETLRTQVEARLDVLEAKIDELLNLLK